MGAPPEEAPLIGPHTDHTFWQAAKKREKARLEAAHARMFKNSVQAAKTLAASQADGGDLMAAMDELQAEVGPWGPRCHG